MSEAEAHDSSSAVSEVEEDDSSDTMYELAKERCGYYRFALDDTLTPQLRCMIRLALVFYKEALEAPETHKHHLFPELNNFHGLIEENWTRVYCSFEKRARLSCGMAAIQEIMASQLLHDYIGTPCAPNEPIWIQKRADKIKDLRASEEDSDSKDAYYAEHQDYFVEPLQQLVFDQEHIETRLITAAEAFEQQQGRRGSPSGYIHHLIIQRDWTSLAEGLWNDRFLTARLYRAEKDIGGSSDKCFNKEISHKVLRGINKVREEYFSELSGPTTFSLSQHARKMSRAPGAEKSAPAEPKTIGQHLESEPQSAWASARGIVASIKNRLGEYRSSAHIAALGMAPGEEMNPLLDPESKKNA